MNKFDDEQFEEEENWKDNALLLITDLVSDYLYYDRKGSEVLPLTEMEKLIESGALTADEIIARFSVDIKKAIKENFKT